MSIESPKHIHAFATALRAAGGRAIIVGGWVRDSMLGNASKDYDLEVYGLTMDELERVLSGFGEVITVGKAFGVLMVKGYDIDFAVPRRDNKVGKSHRDFRMELDPEMSFEEAARRRDLTINAIGFDPLTGEILDAFGGQEDLRAALLRATDVQTFAEDPLRALRVAQFKARFEMKVDDELFRLCRESDFNDLPGERLWEEFKKLLLQSRKPSIGFEFLRKTELLRFFPQLEAMIDVPQDPEWHPEGTVWEHTMLVLDEAAALCTGNEEEDLLLMYGALCHDVGKPATTLTDENGRIRSPNHEPEGVVPTEQFLGRLRASNKFTRQISTLVRYHLAPALLPRQGASPRAYRRLARKCGEAGVSLHLLARVARADHFGRTTPEALAREYPAGETFLANIEELQIQDEPEPPVVLGRHLIARGHKPGRQFKPILAYCRELQDDTGERDVEVLLRKAAERFPELDGN